MARESCPRCYRPADLCICHHFSGIPPVENRTGVIILQHPRERFHYLGTARIARLGLARCRLEVAWGETGQELTRELALPPETGLLYPHTEAIPLALSQPLPRHLLLLDGTWANARKLYRVNPWLESLPHYRLTPNAPGRYRIRGEPDQQSLSTIEAIIQALKILEPHRSGLDRLMKVFEEMIDAQVERIRACAAGPRTRRPRRRPSRCVPAELSQRFHEMVVVYGESAPAPGNQRRLVYLTALRPASGESYERFLRPGSVPPDPRHLEHMGLSPEHLDRGVCHQRLLDELGDFLGDNAVVAAWNSSTLELIRPPPGGRRREVLLKAAYCNLRGHASGSLDQVMAREGLQSAPTPFAGRAAERMGQALAVLEVLRRPPDR